jgi:hypothetical protein
MDDPAAGNNLLISLYESLRDLHQTVFDLGFRVQAAEFALRSFPDIRPVYEDGLKLAKTDEAVSAAELSRKAYNALISQLREGSTYSA